MAGPRVEPQEAGEGSDSVVLLQREVRALRQDLRAHREQLHELVRKELAGFREIILAEVRGLFSQQSGWFQRLLPPETARVPAAPSSPGAQRTQGSSYGVQAARADPRASPTQLLDSERDTQGSQRAGADDTPSTCGARGQSETQDLHSCSARPRGLKLSSALSGYESERLAQQGVIAADARASNQACQAVPHESQRPWRQPPGMEAAEGLPLNGNREEVGAIPLEGVLPGLDEPRRSLPFEGAEAASGAPGFSQEHAACQDAGRGTCHDPVALRPRESRDERASAGAQCNGIPEDPTKVQSAGQQKEQVTDRQGELQWYTKKAETPKTKPVQCWLGKEGRVQRGVGQGKAFVPPAAKVRRRRVPKGGRLQFEEEDAEEDCRMEEAPGPDRGGGGGGRTSQQQQSDGCSVPDPDAEPAPALVRDVAAQRGQVAAEQTLGEGDAEGAGTGCWPCHEHGGGVPGGSAAGLLGRPESQTAESERADFSEGAAELPEGSRLGPEDTSPDGIRRAAGGEGGQGQVKQAKWRSTKRKRAKEAMKGAVIHVLEEDDDFLSTPREKACLMRMQREHSQREQSQEDHDRRGAQAWSFGDNDEAPDRNGRASRQAPGAGGELVLAGGDFQEVRGGEEGGPVRAQCGVLGGCESVAQVDSAGVQDLGMAAANTGLPERLGQGPATAVIPFGGQNEVLPDSDETTRGSSFYPGERQKSTKGVTFQPTDCRETAIRTSYQHGKNPLDPARLAAECKENMPAVAPRGRYGEERQGHLRRALDGNGGAGDARAGVAAEHFETRRLPRHGAGTGPLNTAITGDGKVGGTADATEERQALTREPQQRAGQEEGERGAGEAQGSLLSRPVSVQANAGAGISVRGPAYKYKDVVRRKADREALAAGDCVECRKFYDAVMAGDPHGLMAPCCQQHQEASRHRYRFAPPSTPQGFWNIGFDSDGS